MVRFLVESAREFHSEGKWKAIGLNTSIALVISQAILAFFSVEGLVKFLSDMTVYVVIYVATDHFLSTRQERVNNLHAFKSGIKCLYEDHLYSILHFGVIVAMFFLVVGYDQTPSDPNVKAVYDAFQTLSDAFITVYALGYTLLFIFRMARQAHFDINTYTRLLIDVITMVMAINAVLAGIGYFGDEAYTYYQENTGQATAALVALAMLGIAVSIKTMMGNPLGSMTQTVRGSEGYATGHSMASEKQKDEPEMSQHTLEKTAYHEAGHALFYACIQPYPVTMTLVVKNHYRDSSLGFVTGLGQFELDPTKSMMEWSMLRYLAGDRANVLFNGESNIGASSDNQKWLHVAQQYLAEQYKGTFFVAPKDIIQQQCNNLLMNQLRNEQTALVDAFLSANESIVEDIVGSVLADEDLTLTRNDLVPFMDRVDIIEGIPVIKN